MTSTKHWIDDVEEREFDVIIVGSGAGGSTVMDTVSRTGLNVLMLEEGPYYDHRNVPSRLGESLKNLWRGGGMTLAFGRPNIQFAEGKCVGGGTEINSAIFQRAPNSLINFWSQRYDIEGLSADSLKPHYEWASSVVNASLTKGPRSSVSKILTEAAIALDWDFIDLERGQRGCVGANACSIGCPTGGKQSMTRTLIRSGIEQNRLELVANCKAEKILISDGRAVGVEARASTRDQKNVTVKFKARRGVFLCAGAIHTPTLLMKSARLRTPVGRSLNMHPTLKATAQFDRNIDALNQRLPLTAITEFMPEQRIGGSVSTAATFGATIAEASTSRAILSSSPETVGSYYGMIQATTAGRIQPIPGLAEPLVFYSLNAIDRRRLIEAADRLTRAMFAAGAKRVWPSITDHGGWTDSRTASSDIHTTLPIHIWNLMTIHIFSSVGMGRQSSCAADSYGRIKEIEGLVIADASVVPSAPGVNPQATIMAIARRNALAFLKQLP